MYITLQSIFEFVKCNTNSKNAVEGEEVLRAKQVVLCGKVQRDNGFTIKALVVQSSHIREKPHEVTGEINVNSSSLIIQSFICSCAAGSSESCKHVVAVVVAVLLLLNRNSLKDIDILSSTDVQCQWSRLREPTLQQFKPVPINQFCCVKSIEKLSTTLSKEQLRSALISVSQKSSVALHYVGRKQFNTSFNESEQETTSIEPFYITCHPLLKLLDTFGVLNLGDCCQAVFDNKVKLDDNPINIQQKSLSDKSYWQKIRQFKITGSCCYSLFTYYTTSTKTDSQWALKASKYFWPTVFTNKYVQHGIQYENVAKHLYASNSKQKIIPCGFVTNYNYPWLGYSPDGIIVNDCNEPQKLIEIKCPFLGCTVGLQELIENVKFIIKNADGSLSLNKKGAYYAQVQLGLVLLNLPSCDFVIYSSFEHNYIVINILFYYEYCKTMLEILKIVYFEKLLHNICELLK